MPALTPQLGIPYPLPADPVADYPGLGLNLANVLESLGLAGLRKFWDSSEAGVTFPVSSIVTPTIPTRSKHLLIAWRARSAYGSAADSLAIRFNGITTAAYYAQLLQGVGAAASGLERLAVAYGCVIGEIAAASSAGGNFGQGLAFLANYNDAVNGYRGFSSLFYNSTGSTSGLHKTGAAGGFYAAGLGLQTIEFRTANGAGLIAGTRFTLYEVG